MSLSRRVFLRNGAMAIVGTTAIPGSLTRAAFSAESLGDKKKRLVVIFLRGAADGLNIVVPHGEPAYYKMRPSINIPRSAVIDLDGFFGLHPSLLALQPLWRQRHMAIVHAVGWPDPTRSHLDAQNFMESGTPGHKATEAGWLNRALRAPPQPAKRSGRCGIVTGPSLPRILSGNEPAFALDNIGEFGVKGRHLNSAPIAGANYSRSHFGDSLKQLAQVIKVNLGVQVAFADIGGWDHHVNEGGTQGQIANVLREFSESLAAFWTDLGDLAEDTVIVTMSEFGRSARENRHRGTDHGHANVMFVIGGPVKGGKVYGRWPGLEQSQLYEGRDLAVTTDFRRVLGETVDRHLGNKALNQVFPGFDNQPEKFLNILG
jgi:uncharacterized protein (DUF1501 family)